MPTISVRSSDFNGYFGRVLTVEQINDLCFSFGIELDEIYEEDEVVYKLEVPANRYDLLSARGICSALRLFARRGSIVPRFGRRPAEFDVRVDSKAAEGTRPVILCCVVRGVSLKANRLANLIDLQEKLHKNLGRERTLVSIGIHDLDKISTVNGLHYTSVDPRELSFTPLACQHLITGREELERYYKITASHLKPYFHIVDGFKEWPVLYDSDRDVLSQPPVINGSKSAISPDTRNVLIDVTGTDLQRCRAALVALLHQLPYANAASTICPLGNALAGCDGRCYRFTTTELSGALPTKQTPSDLVDMLARMGYEKCRWENDENTIEFTVPEYRTDVMHLCDIQEDMCIAFGYENIATVGWKRISYTEGKQLPIERISTHCREELACHGYYEALTFVMCPVDELCNGAAFVVVANPKSAQCTSIRQNLWCGLAKTLATNQQLALPIRLFEIGDVIEAGGRQCRHASWLFAGKRTGFEEVVGTADRLFAMLSIQVGMRPMIAGAAGGEGSIWLENRAAQLFDKRTERELGFIGVINPDFMSKLFKIQLPCTVCEIDLHKTLDLVK